METGVSGDELEADGSVGMRGKREKTRPQATATLGHVSSGTCRTGHFLHIAASTASKSALGISRQCDFPSAAQAPRSPIGRPLSARRRSRATGSSRWVSAVQSRRRSFANSRQAPVACANSSRPARAWRTASSVTSNACARRGRSGWQFAGPMGPRISPRPGSARSSRVTRWSPMHASIARRRTAPRFSKSRRTRARPSDRSWRFQRRHPPLPRTACPRWLAWRLPPA